MPSPTGEIVQITPSSIAPGEPLVIYVTYNAYWSGSFIFPWRTRLGGRLDGFETENIDVHLRSKTQRIGEPLRFNVVMPNRPVSGYITLEKISEISQYLPLAKRVTLDNRAFTINLPQQIDPITPKIPSKAGIFPGIPDLPGLPSIEGKTFGIPNKYFVYAAIGCAIATFLYFFVFRKKKKGKKR